MGNSHALRKVQHIIDGQETPSLSGRTFESINPATGQPLAEVAFGEREDVDRAVTAAWNAFDAGVWSKLPPTERRNKLRKIGEIIRRRCDEIAPLESEDTGKPLSSARADVLGAADLFDYYSQLPEMMTGTVYAANLGYFAYSQREPYGVVGAIAPWNFPFSLACSKTAPALAVGNSVVLKMAEQTPLTSTEYGRICLEAGLAPGVLNVVHGDGPTTGAALAAHPRVPKLTFTGSTQVGQEILRAGAETIKSVHLELGGKSPNIVFRDANMEQALAGSLFTSYFNSGQICSSGSRLLVQEDFADEFVDAFTERARRIRVGNPVHPETQLGPVVSAEQYARVTAYIEEGKRGGASVLIGGDRPQLSGLEGRYFVNPTVFRDVKPEMRIAQEEIFGPVLSVMTFKDEEEAIRIANQVMYGLVATVWTNDLQRAFRLAEKLDVGILWTNCPHYLQWNVPYEGHKMSGMGEDMGVETIHTFTKLKVHYINFGGHKHTWA